MTTPLSTTQTTILLDTSAAVTGTTLLNDASSGLLTPPTDTAQMVNPPVEVTSQMVMHPPALSLPTYVSSPAYSRPPNSGSRNGKRYCVNNSIPTGGPHMAQMHCQPAMASQPSQTYYYAIPTAMVGSPHTAEGVPGYPIQGTRSSTPGDINSCPGWGIPTPLAPAASTHVISVSPQYMPVQYMPVGHYVSVPITSIPYNNHIASTPGPISPIQHVAPSGAAIIPSMTHVPPHPQQTMTTMHTAPAPHPHMQPQPVTSWIVPQPGPPHQSPHMQTGTPSYVPQPNSVVYQQPPPPQPLSQPIAYDPNVYTMVHQSPPQTVVPMMHVATHPRRGGYTGPARRGAASGNNVPRRH
jgi:hypothetical protein